MEKLQQREGEGVPLRVSMQRVTLPDGSTATTTALNLTSAPVPTRRYHARVANVLDEDSSSVIAFGQPRLGSDALRSLVLVSISAPGRKYILDSCTDSQSNFLEGLRATVRRGGWSTPLRPIVDEPAQTVSLVANLALIAHSENDAVMDFYHASAWSLHVAGKGGQDLAVDPVVRVDLSASLLLSILEALQSAEKAKKS